VHYDKLRTTGELNQINNAGSISKSKLGANGQITKEYTVTDFGLPDQILFSTDYGAKTLANEWKYTYDPITGNMLSRQNKLTPVGYTGLSNRDFTETFTYDKDRLSSITSHLFNNSPQPITYNVSGGIQTKTDAMNNVQTYDYGTTNNGEPVHAVKNISPLFETYKPLQKIEYTPFNKIQQLTEGDKDPNNPNEVDVNGNYSQLNYWYGLDNERRKMTETTRLNGQLSTRSKFYSLNYEKESTTANGTTTVREINYIFAPDGLAAIYEMKNNTGKYYYIGSDVQGSITMVIDGDNGNVESEMSYDAWGRRRNAQDWSYNNISRSSITDRGYTLHEMLDKFDLINMNGRAYDPLVGQFLSPDPFVQSPTNPQSYNRYAYCWNNPLKYTDPSGYKNTDGNYFDWNWFIDQNRMSSEFSYRNTMRNIESGFISGYSREAARVWNTRRAVNDWVAGWHNRFNSYKPDVMFTNNTRDSKVDSWLDWSGFYNKYGPEPQEFETGMNMGEGDPEWFKNKETGTFTGIGGYTRIDKFTYNSWEFAQLLDEHQKQLGYWTNPISGLGITITSSASAYAYTKWVLSLTSAAATTLSNIVTTIVGVAVFGVQLHLYNIEQSIETAEDALKIWCANPTIYVVREYIYQSGLAPCIQTNLELYTPGGYNFATITY
jgi:RHS repeat-associated protein